MVAPGNMTYRLGFLLCDHAFEALEPRYGDYPEMFAQAFSTISDTIDWRVYDVTRGELPAAVGDCDGYLISGSRHGAGDALAWIPPLKVFVQQAVAAGRPLAGLCFGHQVIGAALGGLVRRAPTGWGIGVQSYEVLEAPPWMTPQLTTFKVPVCHQDQLLTLPAGARRLASSAHCPNFVVRFAPRALGIQGHPEFPAAFVAELIDTFEDALPPGLPSRARASLGEAHHGVALRHWIARFLGIATRDARPDVPMP